MPVIYTAANAKGGVGKTTLVVEVAFAKARQGKRVLVIDGDKQLSATKYMGLTPDNGHGAWAALTMADQIPNLTTERGNQTIRGWQAVVQPYQPVPLPSPGRVDALVGSRRITEAPAEFERRRGNQPVDSFEAVLPWVIEQYCRDYDYIFIDTSPTTDRLTQALMVAATSMIAPVAAEFMALDGMQDLFELLNATNEQRARLRMPTQTPLRGILISKVISDQVNLVAEMQAYFDQPDVRIPHFGNLYIPYTTAGWSAPNQHVPIAVYAPTDPAALQYQEVARAL